LAQFSLENIAVFFYHANPCAVANPNKSFPLIILPNQRHTSHVQSIFTPHPIFTACKTENNFARLEHPQILIFLLSRSIESAQNIFKS
jgi:hypothetical protein